MNLYKLYIIYYFLDVEQVENINGIKNAGAAFLLRVRTEILQLICGTRMAYLRVQRYLPFSVGPS